MIDYKGKYIYLASPYTSDSVLVRETRFLETVKAAAHVIKDRKISAFSPVVHCHPIGMRYALPQEWEFWADYDHTMISNAEELWVLCIPGYTNSMGVQTELKIAEKLGKLVRWLVPDNDTYILTEQVQLEELLYGTILPGRLVKEIVGNVE